MSEAYDDAAVRHWKDADVLEASGRLDNSDHLLGLSAECAIKSALKARGKPFVDEDGDLLGRYWHHIDLLWDRVHLQSLQRSHPGLVALLQSENAYDDWSIEHRYGRTGAVSAEAHARHKAGSKRLLSAVGLLGMRRGDRR